ncbi:hypothetical protein vseg_000839 [Gypsophila vaccaria]
MVYAFNGVQDRLPLWDHLRKLAATVSGPWAIAGDFNYILSAAERVGGTGTNARTDHFRACVGDCGMIDIQSVGAHYTWNNKQYSEDRIYSKLDRFLINKEWSDRFPDAFAHFLPERLYDHTPCIVNFSQMAQTIRNFKYFNMWGSSKSFLPIIRKDWDREVPGHPMFKLVKNLKKLKPALKKLNRDRLSDIEMQTIAPEKRVKKLQEELGQNPNNSHVSEEECRARQELNNITEPRDS